MNKRLKMQERILLITEKTIFNIDPGTYKVKRKISIYDLTSVRCVHHSDSANVAVLLASMREGEGYSPGEIINVVAA